MPANAKSRPMCEVFDGPSGCSGVESAHRLSRNSSEQFQGPVPVRDHQNVISRQHVVRQRLSQRIRCVDNCETAVSETARLLCRRDGTGRPIWVDTTRPGRSPDGAIRARQECRHRGLGSHWRLCGGLPGGVARSALSRSDWSEPLAAGRRPRRPLIGICLFFYLVAGASI